MMRSSTAVFAIHRNESGYASSVAEHVLRFIAFGATQAQASKHLGRIPLGFATDGQAAAEMRMPCLLLIFNNQCPDAPTLQR